MNHYFYKIKYQKINELYNISGVLKTSSEGDDAYNDFIKNVVVKNTVTFNCGEFDIEVCAFNKI